MADPTLITAAVLFFASLAFLSISSLFMVNALNQIAKAIKLSPFLIGVLVLSVATTVPELLNVIVSNLKGISELGIGDVVGASIVDLCLILGLVSLIAKSKVGKLENMVFGMSLVAIATFYFLGRDGLFTRIDGAILFALFIFYQVFLYKQGFKGVKVRSVSLKKISRAYIMAPLAMFALIVSAFLLVETSSHLGVSFGIPVGLIGLIFVAIGTSAPELSSSLMDALKEGKGLGLGTMIGSIVLNFCFATGLGALVAPIAFDPTLFTMPLGILFAASVFFILYINIRKETDKYLGITLLAIYAAYILLNI
jgi:cation:H+ antiporter